MIDRQHVLDVVKAHREAKIQATWVMKLAKSEGART